MELNDRIALIMKANNLSAAAFADKLGVQRSGISHIMSGRNKPSLDFIQRTLNAFPKVDAHWLITGQKKKPTEETKAASKIEVTDVTTGDLKKTDSQKRLNPTQNESEEIDHIVVFFRNGTFKRYLSHE